MGGSKKGKSGKMESACDGDAAADAKHAEYVAVHVR